jgi:signal peptidase II
VRAGRTILLTALVAVAVVAADQASKAIVRASIDPFERVKVIPGVHLINTRNSGVAFSVFSGGGALVVIVAVVALGALLAFFVTHLRRRLVWLPTGMLLGGAAGNLIDRARQGGVTDWIKLPHWPAFNLADACITVGVLVLVYVLERVR